jgi:manganese/zinc/iron transport system substrate-binding protein
MMRLIVLLALALLLAGCKDKAGGKAGADGGKIRCVATTGMVADLVRNVGGEHVEVVALMGPGVDPHLYKASEGDVRKLSEADIVFYNGLHLEAKLADILAHLQGKTTVAVAEGIDAARLLDWQDSGTHDPHVWFDVSLWGGSVMPRVHDALAAHDPEHADDYTSNAQFYGEQLLELHEYVQAQALTVPPDKRVIVTAHDAFRYFGRAYRFEVVGLQGISTEAQAGTADVQRLAKLIAARKIPAIFVESSVPKRNIEAVQEAVKARGWEVAVGGSLFSDALGDAGTAEGTYDGMVRHNIDVIVAALAGDSESKVGSRKSEVAK